MNFPLALLDVLHNTPSSETGVRGSWVLTAGALAARRLAGVCVPNGQLSIPFSTCPPGTAALGLRQAYCREPCDLTGTRSLGCVAGRTWGAFLEPVSPARRRSLHCSFPTCRSYISISEYPHRCVCFASATYPSEPLSQCY